MYISDKQFSQIQQMIEHWIAQPDGWTIFLSIASVMVSVIAVIVSVCTAKKQNKIALYDKKFECYQQLQALKSFIESCEQLKEFKSADDVSNCQQKYLSIHYSVLDREYLRNGVMLRNAYAYTGIEKDRALLTSCAFLGIFKQKDLSNVTILDLMNALESFVKELFKSFPEGKDKEKQDSIKQKHLEGLSNKMHNFCYIFSGIMNINLNKRIRL